MVSKEDISNYLDNMKFKKVLKGFDPDEVYENMITLDKMYEQYYEIKVANLQTLLDNSETEKKELREQLCEVSHTLGAVNQERNELLERKEHLERALRKKDAGVIQKTLPRWYQAASILMNKDNN